MADVIARLKLESNDYDSKIQRAKAGLLQLENECRNAGKSLNDISKENLEFVHSLGQMETVSNSARGKIGEMSQAFTDLSVQYKRLTDEEKNGTYGKALSASLDQLKGRIVDAKKDLSDVSKELNDTSKSGENCSGVVDALAGKFGLSTSALGAWGAALAAGTVALDVAKDAFMASESNIDEWGSAIEGAKGAYNVFLDALNTGSWSNFFANVEKAIKGGNELYNALDRLGSIKGNNQAAIAIVQARIQELRLMKQQGKDVDGEMKKATQQLRALQQQGVKAGKAAGQQSMSQSISNYTNTLGGGVSQKSIDAAIQGILAKGQSEFDKYRETVKKYEEWSKAQTSKAITGTTSAGTTYNVGYEQVFDITKLTAEQRRQYVLAKAITEKETEIQQGISIYAQAVQEGASSAREEFRGNRYASQGSGGKGGGTGTRTTTKKEEQWQFITPSESLLGMVDVAGRSRQDVQDNLNMWKKKYMTATDVEGRTNAKKMQKKYEDELAFMDREENPFAEAYKFDFTKNLDVKPADELAAAGEGVKESWQDAASAIQAVGGALAGLDDPGAKIVGTVGAAIAQIALGFAQATAASSGAGVFGWIAAVAGGLTTMLSTISAIHSATGYANGGIIQGNSFSGDNMKMPVLGGGMVGLNAGELILNRSQQNVLAAELSGNRLSGLNLTSRISGEDIILSLNNRSNRMGKGEYVTSKSRRYGS